MMIHTSILILTPLRERFDTIAYTYHLRGICTHFSLRTAATFAFQGAGKLDHACTKSEGEGEGEKVDEGRVVREGGLKG